MKKISFIWWAVGGVIALGILAYWYHPRIDQYSDIFFYQKMASDVAQVRSGGAPGEPSTWYPPFAAAVFYGISLLPKIPFTAAWLGFVVAAVAAATAYLYGVLRWKQAYLLPLAVLGSALLIGPDIVLARYDILIGLLLVLAWRAHKAEHYAASAMWVVLAVGLKAVPLIVLPVFLLATPRAKWKTAALGLLLGIVLAAGMPAALLGPKHFMQETKDFVMYQGSRGFQVESVWSGIDLLAKNTLHQQALLGYHHFATHNLDLGPNFVKISSILLAAGLLILYWHLWREGKASRKKFTVYLITTLLWLLFIAPVFSPQFLVWLLPLLLMWLGEKIIKAGKIPTEIKVVVGLLAGITLASQWIYPWHYVDFVQQTYLFNTVVLNIRNLAVLGLLIWCLRSMGTWWKNVPAPLVKLREFFARPALALTPSQQKIAGWIIIAIAVAFIIHICGFKILDRDFWWHIKAGEIMVQNKALIATEPFAYTRAGQPYLATQSWLAQIALYGIYNLGGANGIIAFRTLTMLTVFGLLLWIDRKRAWLYSLLVILAANVVQPGFIERPQLFTFILFAAFLYLAIHILKHGLSKKIIIWALALEVLWTNLHGAASFMGVLILGCVAAQYAYDWWLTPPKKRPDTKTTWLPWAYLGGGMLLALFASPATYHNFSYINSLLNDRTIIFINEWQPRPLAVYMGQMILLWLAALLALWKTRRHWVFSVLLLAATGYLSRQALRHEMLFVFSAVAVTIYQLQANKKFRQFAAGLASRPAVAGLLLLVAWGSLALYTRAHFINFAQEDQLYGYGVFAPAKGVYEFITKNNIQGKMFNTYGIGGYLLYKGYPDRQVYIDGRNVDYGFDFMNATYEGALDKEGWKKLEDKYHFTYAIIDYTAIAKVGRAGYSVHLDKNPEWKRVYLDDWTVIYVKDMPENKELIKKYEYKILTPINIDKAGLLETLTVEDGPQAKKELQRAIEDNPDSVKARLLLARLLISDKKFDEARELIKQAQAVQPRLADTYQLLASIAVEQQQWVEAAAQYQKMLRYVGSAYPNIDYRYLASIFSKAGKWPQAAFYNWLAKPDVSQSDLSKLAGSNQTGEATPLPSVSPLPSGAPDQGTIDQLLSGIGEDLRKHNDQGVALAEQGKNEEAHAEFLEALKLDPGNPQTLNNLGALSIQMNKLDEAVDYLKRSFDRAKNDYADAHFNLAIAYYRQGKIEEALKEAKTSQKQGKKEADALITFLQGKL